MDEKDIEAMAGKLSARLNSEAVFRLPPKAKPIPVSTITITFERMPVEGFTQGRVKMVFTRLEGVLLLTGRLRQLVRLDATFEHEYPGFGTAVLHPNDTFDWEIGMREAARDLVWNVRSGKEIFRAFRRWIWLKKAAHECDKHSNCIECPFIDDDIRCNNYWVTGKNPSATIAREFGKVTVEVK